MKKQKEKTTIQKTNEVLVYLFVRAFSIFAVFGVTTAIVLEFFCKCG